MTDSPSKAAASPQSVPEVKPKVQSAAKEESADKPFSPPDSPDSPKILEGDFDKAKEGFIHSSSGVYLDPTDENFKDQLEVLELRRELAEAQQGMAETGKEIAASTVASALHAERESLKAQIKTANAEAARINTGSGFSAPIGH
jgi:hypothetical protein